MLSNLKGYYRPKSIATALGLLDKEAGSVLLIAGGTKLNLTDDPSVKELVDITCLPLNYIKENLGEFRIGATTTLQCLAESPVLGSSSAHIIPKAALLSNHSRMIRNVSTLGGELVTTGSLSVLYCALITLQAQVRIAGGEEFALPMNIFLDKKGLGGGVLVETIVPKTTVPSYSAIAPILNDRGKPMLCVCARISVKKGAFHDTKIAITGTAGMPKRIRVVEKELNGRQLNEAIIIQAADAAYEAYHPATDKFASEEYRKEVCHLVVKRALLDCLEQVMEDF